MAKRQHSNPRSSSNSSFSMSDSLRISCLHYLEITPLHISHLEARTMTPSSYHSSIDASNHSLDASYTSLSRTSLSSNSDLQRLNSNSDLRRLSSSSLRTLSSNSDLRLSSHSDLRRVSSKPIRQSRFSKDLKIYLVVACLWTVTFVGCSEYTKKIVLREDRQPFRRALRAVSEAATAEATFEPTTEYTQQPSSSPPRQAPHPIDITYVDVSNGHRHHPHKGAKDEQGQWGYRHDPTSLRRNPPPLTRNMTEPCKIRDFNYKMVQDRVSVDFQGHYQAEQRSSPEGGKPRAKLLCIVYTTAKSHASKLPAIRETWGPRCDGFMVASTETDQSLDAVAIPHQGEEKYENIWQKIRSIWSYAYDEYYNDYDWFHIGGEDMFVLPENLRLYLESDEIVAASKVTPQDDNNNLQMPLFLGGRLAFEGNMDMIFNQGGGGYTLNKAALKTLVVDGIPNYYTGTHTFTEDVMIAKVFKELGIYPYDTRDSQGAERYHPYSPGFHYNFRQPHDKSHNKMWYAAYIINDNFKEGLDHCNSHSVSFHYIKVDLMYRLYALLYQLCPTDTATVRIEDHIELETEEASISLNPTPAPGYLTNK